MEGSKMSVLEGKVAHACPAKQLVHELNAAGGHAVADTGDIADVAIGELMVNTLCRGSRPAGHRRQHGRRPAGPDDLQSVRRRLGCGHPGASQGPLLHRSAGRRLLAAATEPDGHFRIINFASVSSLEGSAGQPNYAAAKVGIVGLTYSLAQAMTRYGVTANAIAPAAATRDDSRRQGRRSRHRRASGYEVGLYENPQVVRQVNRTAPWDQETLSRLLETSFRRLPTGCRCCSVTSRVAPGSSPRIPNPSLNYTLSLLLMVVLGGAGSKYGALVGAFIYTLLDSRLLDFASFDTVARLPGRVPISQPLFIPGIVFIVMVYFAPGGITALARSGVRTAGAAQGARCRRARTPTTE
jgi:NAD(P)-dependent dehydrogenase (short-subunit alcohol dehydrogenase family)